MKIIGNESSVRYVSVAPEREDSVLREGNMVPQLLGLWPPCHARTHKHPSPQEAPK